MLLRTLAKARGKRVRRCKLFDRNVCHSSTIPNRPWEIDEHPAGDLFSLSVLCNRRPRIALKSNREYLAVEVEADFGFEVFSVNREDRMFQLRAVDSPSHGPLFTRDGSASSGLEQVTSSREFRELLSTLRFNRGESLHVYRNGLVAYLKATSVDEVEAAIRCMYQFAETFRPAVRMASTKALIPHLLARNPYYTQDARKRRRESAHLCNRLFSSCMPLASQHVIQFAHFVNKESR
jgi:hypothetical protein